MDIKGKTRDPCGEEPLSDYDSGTKTYMCDKIA